MKNAEGAAAVLTVVVGLHGPLAALRDRLADMNNVKAIRAVLITPRFIEFLRAMLAGTLCDR